MTDITRYQRQMLLEPIGETGQRRLGQSTALVIGCGALGSVAAELLVRAGVGCVRLVDRDFVEPTNLHRQSLFDQDDADRATPKAEAARRKLAAINPQVAVESLVADVHPGNILKIADGAQVILDGTDNYETRFLINDASVRLGLPWVYGGAVGAEGMQMNVLPHTAAEDTPWERAGLVTACLRCLFDSPPPPGSQPTCDTAGVLGPVAWMVASAQAVEAIKMLLGDWASVDRRLRQWEVWSGRTGAMDIGAARRTDCPCCATRRLDYLDRSAGSQTTTICGRMAVQVLPQGASAEGAEELTPRVDFEKIAAAIRSQGAVMVTPFTLRAELSYRDEPLCLTLFADGRAIIQGTRDVAIARAAYSQFIGL